jgi:hypothetical protein
MISDFAFVVDLAANGEAKVVVQAYEHTNKLTAGEFATIYLSLINGGVYDDSKLVRSLVPVIIIRPAPDISYGDILKFAGPLRTFGPNTIKVAVGQNEYAVVPAAIKEDSTDVKPNPLTLIVNVGENLNVDLNGDRYGNMKDFEGLTIELKRIFREREDQAVFRPNTYETEKTVGIRLPEKMAFSEAMRLVAAIRDAGSDRISFIPEAEVVFDELPLIPVPPIPKKNRSNK